MFTFRGVTSRRRVVGLLLAFAGGGLLLPRCLRAAPFPLAGRDYISLMDWAEARGFRLRWTRKGEKFELVNGSSRISLGVDSKESVVNGVVVWLLYPIMSRTGSLMIARQDTLATLQPILYPPRGRGANAVRTICLDPGHGGSDPGLGVRGNAEKTYTLLLAQELRDQLTRAGFKVTLTRSSDATLELGSRPEKANLIKADLLLSLHFNAVAGSNDARTVNGTEIYCLTPPHTPSTNSRGGTAYNGWSPGHRNNDKSLFLAYQLQKTMTRKLGSEDRGVHRGNLAVLRDASMPGVLIEAGFMTHPDEGRKILTAAYRRQIAQAIVEGIQSYKRGIGSVANLATPETGSLS